MIHLNIENFSDEVLDSTVPVIIDFWAEWCNPCKMMAPVYEELEKEYKGKLKFCKLNTQEEMLIAQQYSVQSIPTLMIFYKGKIIGRFIGFLEKPYLKKIVDDTLKKIK